MSTALDKLDRVTQMVERVGGLADKIPRLAEMIGVGVLAGRASEKIGGDYNTGALGGIVADGLAHSRLPNNQLGGVALGSYFASLGLLTIAPTGPSEDSTGVWDPFGILPKDSPFPESRVVGVTSRAECDALGGEYIETLPSFFGLGLAGCLLPDTE